MQRQLNLITISILMTTAAWAQGFEERLLTSNHIEEDLRHLTDTIGGRPTGTLTNLAAVDWAVERFRDAGVEAWKESFVMPALWLEKGAAGVISGDTGFPVRLAAMPYSVGTGEEPVEAPLVDGGRGSDEDFKRLGDTAAGAFVLIETELLADVPGLFREYIEASAIEARALAAGVAGVVYMGSRPEDVLYRHNASLGTENELLLVVMDRVSAKRALRLLRRDAGNGGAELSLQVEVEVVRGGPYESFNVLAEIPGSEKPEEIVVIGAHLDAWGLGTGALDNGGNCAMLVDIARQMVAAGVQPKRTIRFALWNGEEQGLYGSWGYVKRYRDDLDKHVMASSYDIGSGKIVGFFTGGRPEVAAATEIAIEGLDDYGPLAMTDAPVVGTDNYDFMLEGVANLVANQESANYGPHYHASTDTFDKVDIEQQKKNAVIAASVTLAYANSDFDLPRQTHAEVAELVENTSLGEQMQTFWNLYRMWESGERGRAVEE